jgi:hypothetical protein
LEKAAEENRLKNRLVELYASRNMVDEFSKWLEMDRSEIRDKVRIYLKPKFFVRIKHNSVKSAHF